MPIYTRAGDTGTTSLFGGKRVLKCEELVDVYGSMDELNSWVGLIISEIKQAHLKELLTKIQSDLFTIGGNLAGWKTDLSSLPTRVTEMEVEIDAMEEKLPKLTNFILPGTWREASRAESNGRLSRLHKGKKLIYLLLNISTDYRTCFL